MRPASPLPKPRVRRTRTTTLASAEKPAPARLSRLPRPTRFRSAWGRATEVAGAAISARRAPRPSTLLRCGPGLLQVVRDQNAGEEGDVPDDIALEEPARLFRHAVDPLEAGALHPQRRAPLVARSEQDRDSAADEPCTG